MKTIIPKKLQNSTFIKMFFQPALRQKTRNRSSYSSLFRKTQIAKTCCLKYRILKYLGCISKIGLCLGFYINMSINPAYAEELRARMYTTNNPTPLGQIIFRDTEDGLVIIPTLRKLPPGVHGLHVHEFPNCGNLGLDAGGHFDPKDTDSHQGPYGKGHLGDLPVLLVDDAGNASAAILAPHLNTSMIKNRSIIIHEGPDNYSNKPPLGGGGPRIGCGVILNGH